MSKYRDKLQIIADILSIVSERARKTQIMYQANLSYKLVCRYLKNVLDAGLVFLDDEWYVLTSKGRNFLNKYERYSEFCKNLEEQLNRVNGEKHVLLKMTSGRSVVNPNSHNVDKERGDETIVQSEA